MTNLIQRLFGKHKISREEILSSANDISEIVADLFGVPTTGFNVRVAASSDEITRIKQEYGILTAHGESFMLDEDTMVLLDPNTSTEKNPREYLTGSLAAELGHVYHRTVNEDAKESLYTVGSLVYETRWQSAGEHGKLLLPREMVSMRIIPQAKGEMPDGYTQQYVFDALGMTEAAEELKPENNGWHSVIKMDIDKIGNFAHMANGNWNAVIGYFKTIVQEAVDNYGGFLDNHPQYIGTFHQFENLAHSLGYWHASNLQAKVSNVEEFRQAVREPFAVTGNDIRTLAVALDNLSKDHLANESSPAIGIR